MNKNWIAILICTILIACSPVSASHAAPQQQAQNAILMAQTDHVSVYKFTDGLRNCYFSEPKIPYGVVPSYGGYIWCTP